MACFYFYTLAIGGKMAVKRDNNTNKWYYYGSYKIGNKTKQYKKRGFDRKQDAIKAEIQFKESLMNPGSTMTLSTMIDIYQEYSEKRIKESTYNNHRVEFNVWRNTLGDKALRDITSEDIQDVLERLLTDKKYSTVNEYYMRLCVLMRYATKHEYITTNPCNKVDLKKDPNLHKEEMVFWTEEQFTKFINNVDSTIFHLLFSNQFYMGTRIGEALALQWKDLDFENNTITINKTWNDKLRKCTTPKTPNSYRQISMPQFLTNEYKALKSRLDVPDDSYIFGIDMPFSRSKVTKQLQNNVNALNKRLKDEDKIPMLRMHDLRHSSASYMINNMVTGGKVNFSVYDIAKRLGDELDTVLQVYAHWLPQADKDIVNFMDKNKNTWM